MRIVYSILSFAVCLASCNGTRPEVTMDDLLKEMTDLGRLTTVGDLDYTALQYSSYDRRSRIPGDDYWFANEDGFGGEPVPGFEAILKPPDSSGIGEYLICDIQGPGVIQRLWSAAITGSIRFFLDDNEVPFFEGEAADFFHNPVGVLAGVNDSELFRGTFRQFDASYLPVPFAKGCRIEWKGNIDEAHFYHVGIRKYDPSVQIESFAAAGAGGYARKLEEIRARLAEPEPPAPSGEGNLLEEYIDLHPGGSGEMLLLEGPGAIETLTLKVEADDFENALRQLELKLYFDDAAVPQVSAPAGDFFAAAPGLNPHESLPFSVRPDSTMICRFIMPFRRSSRMVLENHSPGKVRVTVRAVTSSYRWKKGESMHLHAAWSVSHDLTAGENMPYTIDIPYLRVRGNGRLVGAAAFLYNPSHIPTSWGNWWGEGDEKIYVDNETTPSFFGTGSEDYFNYSWSSREIFSYPYCGQPRNDGPGNRGYVANYRWHITDDIPFREELSFFMELLHHGTVPGFSYGRIAYFYALPSASYEPEGIRTEDLREVTYQPWSPVAHKGSGGWSFIKAEDCVAGSGNFRVSKGRIWAEEAILTWVPVSAADNLRLVIPSGVTLENSRIGLTLAQSPLGGILTFSLNGEDIRFDDKESLPLFLSGRHVLQNHFSEPVRLKKGTNELLVRMQDADGIKTAHIDYIWVR